MAIGKHLASSNWACGQRKLAKCLSLVIAALFLFASWIPVQAQIGEKLLGLTKEKVNAEFIPDSAFIAVVAFPQRVAKDPKFDAFPREIVTAWGKKELGFDPMLITQATYIVKEMDNLQSPPKYAAILHFEEMQGLAGNLIDQLEEKKVGDKVMFSGGGYGTPSFLIYDEATMFVGDEELFGDMINAGQSSDLARMVKGASVKGELQAFANIKPVRPILNQLMAGMPAMLPPAVTKLRGIPDMIDGIEIGVDAKENFQTKIILHGVDEEVAEDVEKIVGDAIEFGKDMGLGVLAAQMDFDDPVQEATVEYAQRVADYMEKRLAPKASGKKLEVNLDEEAAVVPILIGFMLPAVQQTRAAARRTQSMNNVRQMTLAFHNYESAHGKFPTQANYDKKGKPLLSWRVHMLPYIEQQELYEQFRLDEPWNSPHNKRLIQKMPPVYRSPSAVVPSGKTVYLGVAGDNYAFSNQERGFGDVTDGTSNTILMVEANPSHAVEWTKPQDWSPNDRNPMDGLGGVQPGGFIVTMIDGSSHFISGNTDVETWKKMLTINGGEIIER